MVISSRSIFQSRVSYPLVSRSSKLPSLWSTLKSTLCLRRSIPVLGFRISIVNCRFQSLISPARLRQSSSNGRELPHCAIGRFRRRRLLLPHHQLELRRCRWWLGSPNRRLHTKSGGHPRQLFPDRERRRYLIRAHADRDHRGPGQRPLALFHELRKDVHIGHGSLRCGPYIML
jgi:hypothetical protein